MAAGLEAWMSRRVARSLGFSLQEDGACFLQGPYPVSSSQQGLSGGRINVQPGRVKPWAKSSRPGSELNSLGRSPTLVYLKGPVGCFWDESS